MSLRVAAGMPWCREWAILVVVIACIAMPGSAPAVKTHEATVARLATALTADTKFNDTKFDDTNINVAKPDVAKLDESRVASAASEEQPALPSKIELAPVAGTTLEIEQTQDTAHARNDA